MTQAADPMQVLVLLLLGFILLTLLFMESHSPRRKRK